MRKAYVVLVLAILIAAWRLQTPTPIPADAPPSVFSATRAFADIRAIAQRPHPVGTADHDRVRAYLVDRLAAMDLAPQQQAERITNAFAARVISAPVANIAAILKGKDRTKPAVLVMSHYDSVPDSPGAADDTAGVATTLEIARVLKAGPQPERDVIFLFTDGEELGLMGATAFFHHNPLAAHVGVVINFEARGDSGLTPMFETGPLNAETVALFVAKAPRPSANSFARAIYKRMPNGSDFTLAVERGLPGLNFAFIGDEAAYHTPLATPAHLNLGSVQHMGDQALAAARAFATTLPQQKADAVYSDVLGFFVIQYSFAAGWVLLALTAALMFYAVWASWRLAPVSWWRGIAGSLSIIVLPTMVLGLAGYAFNGINHFLRLAHFDYLLAGAAALAIGSVLLVAVLYARHKSPPAALWQTLSQFLLLAAALAQSFEPEIAFMLVWPLLAAALVAALRFGVYRGKDNLLATLISATVALVILAQTACAFVSLFTAVGVDMPAAVMLILLPAVPLLLLLPQSKPMPLWTPAVVVAAGAMFFAYGTYASPTAERPQPSLVRHVQDLDSGKAWRVAYLNSLDPWTKAALGAPRQEALPWSEGWKVWLAPTKAVAVPSSNLTIEREGGHLKIRVKTAPGAYSAVLSLRASEPLPASTLDGEKIAALNANAWQDLHYYSPGQGDFTRVIDAPTRGTVEAKLNTIYLDWPKDAAKLPPMPASQMAFEISNSTETVTRRTWRP